MTAYFKYLEKAPLPPAAEFKNPYHIVRKNLVETVEKLNVELMLSFQKAVVISEATKCDFDKPLRALVSPAWPLWGGPEKAPLGLRATSKFMRILENCFAVELNERRQNEMGNYQMYETEASRRGEGVLRRVSLNETEDGKLIKPFGNPFKSAKKSTANVDEVIST